MVKGKMLPLKKFVIGAALVSMTSIPVLTQNSGKALEKKDLLKNGSELIAENNLVAENKGDEENSGVKEERIPMFYAGGKACYPFQKVDGKFSLFEREDGKIIAGFYVKRNGETKVESLNIYEDLEDSGYTMGDSIAVHVLDEGKKYVLFPKGSTRALIVWGNTTETGGGDYVALLPKNVKEGDHVSEDFQQYGVERVGDGGEGTMYVSGNFLFVIPKKGYTESLITRLDIIVEMEKKLGTEVSDISEFNIEPYGDTAGSDFNMDAEWVYALRVTKRDDPNFERIYVVSFGDGGVDKQASVTAFAVGG